MKKLNANYEARLYKRLSGNKVRCSLCPRRCVIDDGSTGRCRVRMNEKGKLYAISYGRAVHVAEEFIETEAVFHFEPGSRILSVGNVGCNLSCVYCQNWRFSQLDHINENDIFEYTPEQIVRMALEKGIKVISWTYNDPAIWLEFVEDTAKLARRHGIYNLFKSALFLTPEAIEAFMDVIDIFSISVKSLDPDFYRRFTGGWIKPVIEGTQQIFKGQRHHMEISNLIVTDANDNEKDYMDLINWVKAHLSVDVPIHFVRFHPNYKYTHVSRPTIETLERARELAKASGIRHCYLGNVFMHEGANTYCSVCNSLLVERRGLNAEPIGLESGKEEYICRRCKNRTQIKMFHTEESFYESIEV
ncbi:MAG: AmmeMemoRadiSam system radical SAM enzyme [Candidatus Omnitrophica bacterium]|nr:AmmeMemoRadiSam system radical SAM enzyme [Candidatus Omnitrophota bacterium]MBU1853062.1 AmmeMemoRadiSam system radical SAM enzyme [Candidatus Omnitrophota bacterium]